LDKRKNFIFLYKFKQMKKLLFPAIIFFSFLSFHVHAQAKYYVNSNIGQPWGVGSNTACMNSAFGAGNWTQGYFESVNPNALFSATVCFVFMDGSQNNATALNNFLAANTILMQNWVAAGGKLFLNAAPTVGGNINFGFGTTLNYPVYSNAVSAAPGMNALPVFSGPVTPAGTNYGGNYYGHGSITGGTNVPVINGTLQPVLAERYYGAGHVFFGGATTANWHTPAPNGTNFRVNLLTYLGGCCGASSSVTAVASPSSICAGQSVTITASQPSGGTFTCFPGNLSGATVVVSPTVSTNYNIVGTPTSGCIGGATIRIIVGAASPTLSVAGNTAICPGGTINLTASGANSYTWSTGAFTSTISQTPGTNTVYTVVGTASTGCTGTLSQAVVVNPNPTISISGGSVVCGGASLTLTAGGANSYSWSNGALTPTISISPTVNTTYSVIGTTSAGCTGTASQVITISPSPTVSITGGTVAVCAGTSVLLTASGANSYSWSNGGITSTIAPSPTVNTSYTVIGTSTTGCTGMASQALTVNPLPTLSVSGSNTICSGQSITLTASGANTYTWSNGPLTASMSTSPPVTTNYTVAGTNTVSNCSNSFTTSIIVSPAPSVAISGANTSCSGSPVNLTAGGASTYSWNTGALTSTIAPSPSVNTTYSVIGTITAGCTGTSAITVSVGTSPTITVSGNNNFCVGQTTTLTASGANSYLWNNGSFSSSIVVTPSVSINYTATGTSTSGCTGSGTISITVNQLPVVSVTGGGSICAGQSATLTAGGAGTYTWNTGPTSASIIVTPSVNTTFSVAGTSTAGCVGNTTTVSVTVIICTGLYSQNVIISAIKIYPNPNRGEFTVECANGLYNIELTDVSGRIILSGSSESYQMKINIMHLASGIYYAKIKAGKGYEVFKIVKE